MPCVSLTVYPILPRPAPLLECTGARPRQAVCSARAACTAHHATANVRCPTSNLRGPAPHLKHPTSSVQLSTCSSSVVAVWVGVKCCTDGGMLPRRRHLSEQSHNTTSRVGCHCCAPLAGPLLALGGRPLAADRRPQETTGPARANDPAAAAGRPGRHRRPGCAAAGGPWPAEPKLSWVVDTSNCDPRLRPPMSYLVSPPRGREAASLVMGGPLGPWCGAARPVRRSGSPRKRPTGRALVYGRFL